MNSGAPKRRFGAFRLTLMLYHNGCYLAERLAGKNVSEMTYSVYEKKP